MKSSSVLVSLLLLSVGAHGAPAPVSLPALTVYSTSVANQEPVDTFAMPVSALRFEPGVDVQERSTAEGQADVAIRGGIFENTGIRIGALSLFDPQTGHYLEEIPIAPAMLGTPQILTGADNAQRGWNADAGTIAYDWRPIRHAGFLTLGGGQFHTDHEEVYEGRAGDVQLWGRQLGADASIAHSSSDGSVAFGESRFNRVSARIQLAGRNAQTDLFYGYQAKAFGWPNLYTPFNFDETENLETVLVGINHRQQWNSGSFVELGAYWRRNKDDYAFNRFAPVGPVHPFQHTTRTEGTSLDGRLMLDGFALGYKAGVSADDLRSTSLTFGNFHKRTYTTAGLYPEKRWSLAPDRALVVTAGATYDDTNHDSSAVSPLFTLAEERTGADAIWQRIYLSYAQTTQVPTYTALNSSATSGLFRGNPNLGREKSRNVEVGVSGTADGWRTKAAIFYRRDDNLVDWTYKTGVTARTANAVNIDTAGVELFARKSFDFVDLVLGYTWLGKDADYGTAAVDASFYALNYPRNRVTAAVVARMGGGWEVRFDNEARWQAYNPLRTTRQNAVISALGVSYRPPQSPNLIFSVQADNLWDSDFQAVPAVPASRRQVSGSVTYTW
ncbi:MAG TPA: TonB-dependent receptor [Opitutaceae bacterium]|nr:TonB-dependent receptor [Opitutaceae bacterium]